SKNKRAAQEPDQGTRTWGKPGFPHEPPPRSRALPAVCLRPAKPASGRQDQRIDSPAVNRFAGKRGLVLGVANKRSIAWAIARRLADGGAQLAFTYQGERIEAGVRELCGTVDAPLLTECDVRSDDDLARVVAETGEMFGGKLDLLVHS